MNANYIRYLEDEYFSLKTRETKRIKLKKWMDGWLNEKSDPTITKILDGFNENRKKSKKIQKTHN